MKTDEEKIKQANVISKFTKNLIVWDGSYYINEKEYDYNMKLYNHLVIRYYLSIGKKRIPLIEVHDKFIDTLKNTIKVILLTIKYMLYSKYENNKKIKEHKKNVEKLENKHIKFE